MNIKKLVFGGAFVFSIAAAFAFKTPSPKQALNSAAPGACSTLIKFCPGGAHICSSAGISLEYSNGSVCNGVAKMP